MNYAKIEFSATSQNESFARNAVAAFLLEYDPTVEMLADIKTAVSEAVTNSIVHGYRDTEGLVILEMNVKDKELTVTVEDYGCGISDVEKAREPLYTTHSDEERSGMGFTVMEMFMDNVDVVSRVDIGTKVVMTKHL